MWEFIKAKYAYIHGSFHESEVIAWSRFNVALGSAWVALQASDISPLVNNPRYMAYYIIFSNFVNEMLRRRRADYDDKGALK